MRHGSTLYVGLDVPKDSIAVAYATTDGPSDPVHVGAIGTRQCDIDALVRKLQSKSAHLVFIYEAGPCGHYVPKRVTNAGTIRFKRRLLFIANSLKQQVLGLEEVGDGVWSIYFCNVL